jgi:methylase of polypeptide subunit release factors
VPSNPATKTGFDVVIGNPPYVSTRNMSNALKESYKSSYTLAHGQYDLFILFIEKANTLLNDNGIFSFIIPKNLLTNENFRMAREFLLKNLPVKIYLDAQMPFEFAAVEANVIVSSRKKTDYVKTYIYKSGKVNVNFNVDTELIKLMPFNIFPFTINPENILILNKILRKAKNKLEDYVDVIRGMECGFNHSSISKNIGPCKIIKGEHIDKYSIKQTEWYVKPKLCEKKILKSEYVYKTTPKLVTKFVSNSLDFALDKVGYYNTNVVYNVLLKKEAEQYIKFFLGLCNSKLINFWFFNTYINDDKLFPHIQKNQLDSIPIVFPSDIKSFDNIVNKILSVKKENPQADTSELEKQIDELVYGLYGLSEKEIGLIEKW